MKKIIFIGILAVALLVTGCLAGSPKPPAPATYDCGSDMQCFLQQARATCGPANVTITRLGVLIYAEVTPSGENCNVFIRLKDIQLPANATDEDSQALDELRPFFSLATMNCNLTKEQLTRLEEQGFLTEDEVLNQCNGLLKDRIVEQESLFNATATPSPTASPAAPTPSATPTITGTPCTETDGGKNYYSAGTLSGSNSSCSGGTCYDSCYNGQSFGSIGWAVSEWWCQDGFVLRETYNCPSGSCQAGACAPAPNASPTAYYNWTPVPTTAYNVTPSPAANATPTPNANYSQCVDSDGFNLYVQGNVTGGGQCNQYPCWDSCYNGQSFGSIGWAASEWFCFANGSAAYNVTTCLNGCAGGKCVTPTPSPTVVYAPCNETDGGKNYFLAGSLTGGNSSCSGGTCQDSCYNGQSFGSIGWAVSEWWCVNNTVYRQTYNCPSGSFQVGACVQ